MDYVQSGILLNYMTYTHKAHTKISPHRWFSTQFTALNMNF